MAKPHILIQLDADPHPSVFDSVVAVDAGVDHLLQYANVQPEAVRDLVYGAMFTRGPEDLKHTAIFIGGSDVSAGEALLKAVTKTFFAPLRVSVLMDANGCNTTAAAAVIAGIGLIGTAVLLPMLRNPVVLAHQLATLDQISEGRIIIGVGVGHDLPPSRAEFEAGGVFIDD